MRSVFDLLPNYSATRTLKQIFFGWAQATLGFTEKATRARAADKTQENLGGRKKFALKLLQLTSCPKGT